MTKGHAPNKSPANVGGPSRLQSVRLVATVADNLVRFAATTAEPGSLASPIERMESFLDVTEIMFEEFSAGSEKCKHRFSITSPAKVGHLVSLVDPKPWTNGVPTCLHVLFATFKRPSGCSRVDFCRICFGHQVMPTDFYVEYRRLSRRHRWRIGVGYVASALIAAAILLTLYIKLFK